MKSRVLPKSANLLPFEEEGSAGLPNLPNLPFLELGSESNTNSYSSKSAVLELVPIKHTINAGNRMLKLFSELRLFPAMAGLSIA